jgi:prepilin signal peptidase PulO-like enzyme (type II secretory pathway)
MLKKLKKHSHLLHKTGFYLSIVCLIHCLATPFIVTLLPFVGKNYISHSSEIVLVGVSVLIGIFLLTKDYQVHHNKLPFYMLSAAVLFQFLGFFWVPSNLETPFVVLGSLFMAVAYVLNWRLHRTVCHTHSH